MRGVASALTDPAPLMARRRRHLRYFESLTMANREQIVRDSYAAFAAGDRRFFEERLSDDFLFSAPPDPRLNRDGYFERCWPGAGRGQDFEIVRLIESGDAVIVTYETETSAGRRGRNTEIHTFDDEDKITRTEVYFGWDLE